MLLEKFKNNVKKLLVFSHVVNAKDTNSFYWDFFEFSMIFIIVYNSAEMRLTDYQSLQPRHCEIDLI